MKKHRTLQKIANKNDGFPVLQISNCSIPPSAKDILTKLLAVRINGENRGFP